MKSISRVLPQLVAAILPVFILALPFSAVRAETTLSVAYIPVMPMAQLFVMEGEGWAKKAGLNLELTKFSSGPAMVQAIAAGRYDVMYIGIGPALVARANGVPIKVVAANVIEQVALIAQGDLAKAGAGIKHPADALRRFIASDRRKPKIATLPKGSVPDLALRYWLAHAGLTEDSVEIIGMGEDKVQQALIARAVDGASILEPIITIVRERMPDADILVWGSKMFPKLPGAVVAVREGALTEKREAVERLVELHIRATRFLHEHPENAARDIEGFIGQGLVSLKTMEHAVRSPINHFVSDPREIVAATKEMNDFSEKIGAIAKPVAVEKLFDTSIYEQAEQRK